MRKADVVHRTLMISGSIFALTLTLGLADVPYALAEPACGPTATIAFVDSAPTDKFRIENKSPDTWAIAEVKLDLSFSPSGVFFDPTGTGVGSSVFQPFADGGGDAVLSSVSPLSDGDTQIALSFQRFPPAGMYNFSADVDDATGAPTRVYGNEIAGARATVTFQSELGTTTKTGTFDASGAVMVGGGAGCV